MKLNFNNCFDVSSFPDIDIDLREDFGRCALITERGMVRLEKKKKHLQKELCANSAVLSLQHPFLGCS